METVKHNSNLQLTESKLESVKAQGMIERERDSLRSQVEGELASLPVAWACPHYCQFHPKNVSTSTHGPVVALQAFTYKEQMVHKSQ